MSNETYMPNGSLMPPEGEAEATPSAEAAEHKALPCPFCGGLDLAARIEQEFVECLTCGAQGAFRVELRCYSDTVGWLDKTDAVIMDGAYVAWNNRKDGE